MDINSLKILGPRILVKMDEEAEYFSGGVLVKPSTVHEQAEIMGEVLAVGTGMSVNKKPGRIPIEDIEVGDRVYFVKFHELAGDNPYVRTMLGKGYMILDVRDVLCKGA